MIKKQDDPRMKNRKQNIARFEAHRKMIRTDLTESLNSLKEAQKTSLDEGGTQMELFAAEKLQPEIDQMEELIRHLDSLIPENIKQES